MQIRVIGIFWVSECTKAPQYAFFLFSFFFLYTSIFKGILGMGNPLLPKCPSQDAAPSTGLMPLFWAGSCPSTLPILEQTDRKQRRKLGFEGFFCSFFPPSPTTLHGSVLQKPKHLPCSTWLLLGLG